MKGEGQRRLPTEYTEKHGKRAKIKGKKSKGEFMPAAQNQGKKQGRIYDYIQKPNRTTLNIGINFSVFSNIFCQNLIDFPVSWSRLTCLCNWILIPVVLSTMSNKFTPHAFDIPD